MLGVTCVVDMRSGATSPDMLWRSRRSNRMPAAPSSSCRSPATLETSVDASADAPGDAHQPALNCCETTHCRFHRCAHSDAYDRATEVASTRRHRCDESAKCAREPTERTASRRSNPAPSEASSERCGTMSNFDFVSRRWPSVHADCARAESRTCQSDPRSACFYSRRAVEQLVGYLYDVLGLPLPYQDDLAARINDAGVQGQGRRGDQPEAEPDPQARQPRRPRDRSRSRRRRALQALRELHHVVVWAAFRYSTNPQAVPTAGAVRPGAGREGGAAVPRGARQARGEVQGPGRGARQGAGREGRAGWPRRRPRSPRCASRSRRPRPPTRRSTTTTTPRPRPATCSSTSCSPRPAGR